MKRVVVVYNERSSRVLKVKNEVLEPLFASGFSVLEFKVRRASVVKNAERLKGVLEDGDLVIAAGGDGTATAALNGVILSGKKVKFSVLPYGNFNDVAKLFRVKKLSDILEVSADGGLKVVGVTRKMYPLEMKVDDEHFRYAACYFTVGMFAESTRAFNDASVRQSLVSGRKSLVFSIFTLFSWWLKNRKKQFLPADLLATDIMAVNGRRVAKVMKGEAELAFSNEGFLAGKEKLSSFFGIFRFMIRSILFRIPGKVANKVKVERGKPFSVEVQAEGEYENVRCRKIEIIKMSKSVEVVLRR